MKVPKKVYDEAMEIINTTQGHPDEDEWYGIGKGFDLNVYTDMDGDRAATLYPVVNGQTVTTEEFADLL